MKAGNEGPTAEDEMEHLSLVSAFIPTAPREMQRTFLDSHHDQEFHACRKI